MKMVRMVASMGSYSGGLFGQRTRCPAIQLADGADHQGELQPQTMPKLSSDPIRMSWNNQKLSGKRRPANVILVNGFHHKNWPGNESAAI